MKMEAVWVLSNLVYGESKVIAPIFDPVYNFLPTLNVFLNGDSKAMIEQTLWFVGNAIADN